MGELASLFGGGDSVNTSATATAALTSSTPFVNNAEIVFGKGTNLSGSGIGQANPTSSLTTATTQTPTSTTGPLSGSSAIPSLTSGSDTWLLILGAAVAAAVVLVKVLGKK